MHYTLTDSDVRLFLREAPQRSSFSRALPFVVAPLAIALVAAGAMYFLAPSNRVLSQAPVIAPSTNTAPQADAPTGETTEPAAPAPTATPLPVTLANNTFAAPDIKISAPVIWNVPFNDKAMNAALQNGVIHIEGTSRPGLKGMSAIAGHSSNYAWAKGNFNSIFSQLPKAKAGQTLEINYEGTMYRYQVTKVYEVKPENVAILGDNNMTGIRLITCTPVGTTLRRLIVDAQQIFPDPALAAPFNGASFTGSLPSGQ